MRIELELEEDIIELIHKLADERGQTVSQFMEWVFVQMIAKDKEKVNN